MVATSVSIISGPAHGAVSSASSNFTVEMDPNTSSGSPSCVVTPHSSRTGTFSPTTVTLTDASRTATFTFTPSEQGSHTITITNNQSLTNVNNWNYLATGSVASGSASVRALKHYSGGARFQADPGARKSPKQYSGPLMYYDNVAFRGSKACKDYTGPLSISITTPPGVTNRVHLFFQVM